MIKYETEVSQLVESKQKCGNIAIWSVHQKVIPQERRHI